MKGRRLANNLYAGSVVIGKAEDDSMNVAASKDNEALYKLWHARLGHMSDHGMNELIKQHNRIQAGSQNLM